MRRNSLVSIIVLNFNGGKVTEDCLNSVLKSNYSNFEVILVDNGSKIEETIKLKKIYGSKIKLVLNERNLGYAAGNNLGASLAKGEFIVFLNNDTIVPANWLSGPLEKLRNNPKIAFLQPKIKWLKNKKYFEYCGGAGGLIDLFGYPFVRGRIFGSIEEDVGQYDDEKEIFWASGVALFGRRTVFNELNGFDTFFFIQMEDVDLCFRAHRKGYKIFYLPSLEIFHLGSYTGNRDVFKKSFLNHRNHLVMLLKNLSWSEIFWIFPLRVFLDFCSVFYYITFLKSTKLALTVFQAYLSFFVNVPVVLGKRRLRDLGSFGYPSDLGLVYRGSVVWQYFILGKKKWSEICSLKKSPSKIIKIF